MAIPPMAQPAAQHRNAGASEEEMKIRRHDGFSLIEAMVVVAVIAILATVAAPSYIELIGKQRLKGAASVLYGDLQYARSEAVQRNTPVTVTFDTSVTPWCYIIHTGTTCTCGASGSCTGSAVNLKNVSGADSSGVTMALSTGVTEIAFEPRQGTATPGIITFTGINSLQVQNQVNLLGRVRLCSPGGAVSGYSSC